MVITSPEVLIFHASELFSEPLEMTLNMRRRFCENNPDPNYGSCSQPQELTDEDIDKQLVGSEVHTALPSGRMFTAPLQTLSPSTTF